jgi:N-acetylglucosaminyl-diphospho-decaprenol L-rhamnosyltransferase
MKNLSPTSSTVNLSPEITVLTVSHGHGSLLIDLLESLETDSDNSLEWLCLLNIPEDDPIYDRLTRSQIQTQILENDYPRGLAANLNTLLNKTRSKSFLIVNPDVILPQGTLRNCHEYMIDSQADLITCPSLDFQGLPLVNIRYFPTPASLFKERILKKDRRLKDQEKILRGQESLPFWFQGSFLMGKTQPAKKIGFNEAYPLYFEDVEFCWNYWKKGLKLSICQNAQFKHLFMRKSSRLFSREMLLHCISAWRYFSYPRQI